MNWYTFFDFSFNQPCYGMGEILWLYRILILFYYRIFILYRVILRLTMENIQMIYYGIWIVSKSK